MQVQTDGRPSDEHRLMRRRLRFTAADADAMDLIRAYTRVQPAPLVPEVRLHLADALVPLWQEMEWRAGAPQPPPFWAFAWPGSAALARYIFDTPGLVNDTRVVDLGSGSGLAAIAAARCGARHVRATDIAPLAGVVQGLNAELNNVTFESVCADIVNTPLDADLILAGDLCYERETAQRIIAWLRRLAAHTHILLAEPGRHYAPGPEALELVATYDVPTLHELESVPQKRTRVWRILPEI